METIVNENDVVQLLRGFSIPAQPQILVDLAMAQVQPDCELSDIARIISKDISVAGSVLKVANSPFYGLTRSVTSIENAILMIGLRGMMNIINGIALRQESTKYKTWNEDELKFLNRLWDCAEDVARVSSYLSQQIGIENPEEMYSLGLFHNAGMPLLLAHSSNYPQVLMEAYATPSGLLTDTEDRYYNTNHAVLGYYLARSWRMPVALCDTIVEHHNLLRLFSEGIKKGSTMLNRLALLKVAENMVGLHFILGRYERDCEWESLEELLLAYLNLSREELDDLHSNCQDLGILNQDLNN